LSRNTNIKAINILKQNKDKINWFWLSLNPNAIDYLEENTENIDWNYISRNSNIFTNKYINIFI
jgi:hypothetical protein